MRPDARDAEQQREAEHPAGEQHDVLAATPPAGGRAPSAGSAFCSPGESPLSSPSRTPSTTARRSPARPGAEARAQPAPQPVADSAEPAAAAVTRPLVDLEDDVDALPAQPGALVEAVRRPARQPHDREQARRGRPAAASARAAARAGPARRHAAPANGVTRAKIALVELPTRGSAVTTAVTRRGAVDLRPEQTAVERVEPVLPHHQPRARQERGDASRPRAVRPRARGGAASDEPTSRARSRRADRQTQPGRRSRSDDVGGQQPAHGTTSPCRSAIRAGPMPGIASSPSTERNARAAAGKRRSSARSPARPRAARRAARRWRSSATPARPTRRAAAPGRRHPPRAGDDHLLAVGDGRREVHAARSARRVSPPARATASETRAPSAGARARATHRAGDVDHERRRPRRTGRTHSGTGRGGRGRRHDRRDPDGVRRAPTSRHMTPRDDDHDEREQRDGNQPPPGNTEGGRGHGCTVPEQPSRVGNASVTKPEQLASPRQRSPRTISPASPVSTTLATAAAPAWTSTGRRASPSQAARRPASPSSRTPES